MIPTQSPAHATSSIILQSTNAATWEWNIQTGAVIFNDRWAEIIGYTLAELAPLSIDTWTKLVHPADLKRSEQELEKVFKKKKKFYSVEVRMKHRNGRWVWVLDSGAVIEWDAQGKPLLAAGTHINIDSIKRLQLHSEKNELKLKTILENTKDIIYRIALNGHFSYLSQAWTKQLGWAMKEAMQKSYRPFVHPEDLENLNQFFLDLRTSKTPLETRGFRLMTKGGQWRHYETSASPILERGKIKGYAGIARDITEDLKIHEALFREKEHLRITLHSVGDAVIVTNNNGRITDINLVAEKLLRIEHGALNGEILSSVFHLFHRDTLLPYEDIVNAVIRKGGRIEIRNVCLRVAKDIYVPIDDSAAPIMDQGGDIQGVVIVFRDISEDLELLKKIEYLSYHDQQTDFFNRHYFHQCEPLLKTPENLPMSFMVFDVNDLKLINDTFGHSKGDDVLQAAARILRHNLSKTPYLFRMGGDEFLAILTNTDQEEVKQLLQAIRDDIARSCNENCPLTLASGYAVLTEMSDDVSEAIRLADMRMYEDKKRQK